LHSSVHDGSLWERPDRSAVFARRRSVG
jgi:hypothetical protein